MRSAALIFLAATLGLSACSSAEHNEATATRPSDAETAKEVCGGALTGSAAKALEEITRSKIFKSEMPEKASSTIRLIKEELPLAPNIRGEEHITCRIYAYRNYATGIGTLEISFQWSRAKSDGSPHSTEKISEYDLADGAMAWNSSSAIRFRCPIGNETEDNSRLTLDAWLFNGQWLSAGKRERLPNVRVLHGFSVDIAKKLGCLDSGNLPKKLGSLKLYPLEEG